jgi:hypothetical protein
MLKLEAKPMNRFLCRILRPQPVLGVAAAILFFSFLWREAATALRGVRPANSLPVKVWMALDDRLDRSWDRAVKHFESRRLVFEIRYRLEQ